MTDILGRLKAALADRYTIERELGQGGMAAAYLGQDRKLGDSGTRLPAEFGRRFGTISAVPRGVLLAR